MSFSIVDVVTAIRTRALADTGVGGLFNASPLVTGFFWHQAPATQAYPYIILDVANSSQQDGFSIDVVNVTVRFRIINDLENASTPGLETSNDIIKRIYGDALSQAGRTPSFGFHRWKPTIGAGTWTATVMERTNGTLNSDEDHIEFVEEYGLTVSRT